MFDVHVNHLKFPTIHSNDLEAGSASDTERRKKRNLLQSYYGASGTESDSDASNLHQASPTDVCDIGTLF